MGTVPHALLSMVYLSDFSPSTITSGAAGAWSVATEAAFYMTLPLLFRWIRTPLQALPPLCLCTAFAYFIAPRIANHAGAEGFWLYQSLPANYPTFLLGVCGFFVWQRWIAPDRFTTEDRRSISACLLVAFGVLYMYALPFSFNKLTSESLILLLLVLALVTHPWRLLVNPVTVLLGKVSFSLYLLHFYVARYVERFLLFEAAHHGWAGSSKFQFCAEYLLTLFLTLPLALATWQWIEKPGIRLGRSLIGKLEQQRAASDRFPALTSTRDTPDSQF
jgi:peptidoglycan/LPS O-acetylase OafA/YrhL